jgi:hypothetical protein
MRQPLLGLVLGVSFCLFTAGLTPPAQAATNAETIQGRAKKKPRKKKAVKPRERKTVSKASSSSSKKNVGFEL